MPDCGIGCVVAFRVVVSSAVSDLRSRGSRSACVLMMAGVVAALLVCDCCAE